MLAQTSSRICLSVLFMVTLCFLSGQSLSAQDNTESAQSPEIITPETAAIDIFYAAVMIEVYGVFETEYFANEGNGKYGCIDDLVKAGYITESEMSENFSGFKIYWYLNADRSDFAITAIPVDNPDLIGLLTNSSGTLYALAEYVAEDGLSYWFREIFNAEKSEFEKSGSYDFIDNPVFDDLSFPMSLYLSCEKDAYFILHTEETDNTGVSYASDNGKVYVIVPYSPEIGTDAEIISKRGRSIVWSPRVIGLLNACGSSNLAFARTENDGKFGDFNDLQKAQFIAEGYTPQTMMDNYELLWFLNEDKSGFAIVAMPTEYKNELEIFMIDETQVIWKLILSTTVNVNEQWYAAIYEETKAFEGSGKYAFIGLHEDEGTIPRDFTLYLNTENDSYVLNSTLPVLREIPYYLYISPPGIFYEKEAVE